MKEDIEQILRKYYFKIFDNTSIFYWTESTENETFICPYFENENQLDKIISIISKNDSNWRKCYSLKYDIELISNYMKKGFMVIVQRKYVDNEYNLLVEKTAEIKITVDFLTIVSYKNIPIINLSNFIIPKSISRLLNRYKLLYDKNFHLILDECAKYHEYYWLTPKLVKCFKEIYNEKKAKMVSFELYDEEDNLVAGEFGVLENNIYISYTGFHTKSSTGIVQMILTFKFLYESGVNLCVLPGTKDDHKNMEYKYKLGAYDVSREQYFKIYNENTPNGYFA